MRLIKRALIPLLAAGCAIAVAACGSSSSGGSSTSSSSSAGISRSGLADIKPSSSQVRGGTLKVISNEGWEHLDPGASYFQIDYVIEYATQSPLYTYTPTNSVTPTPLVASGPPQISSDGKTVTVHIKPNWKFSPPVNRAVTSSDVAFAFERMFNANVQNGYAAGYFPIVGAKLAPGNRHDPGISTPNKTTIVFHLTKAFGATMAKALTLPGTSAIPAGYTNKADKSSPSTWDSKPTTQVFTGPYMIKSYSPGRQLVLVRNPNWSNSPSTACARPMPTRSCGTRVSTRPSPRNKTLDSTNLLMADTCRRTSVLKQAYEQQAQAADRRAARDLLRGAEHAGAAVQQHQPAQGSGRDGEPQRLRAGSRRQARRNGGHALHLSGGAGLRAGRRDGGVQTGLRLASERRQVGRVQVHEARGLSEVQVHRQRKRADRRRQCRPRDPQEMQTVQSGLTALGFKTTIKAVPQQTMYSKFCGYVKAHVNVCPTAGWIEDFPDPYAALFVPFSGEAIVPINNSTGPSSTTRR